MILEAYPTLDRSMLQKIRLTRSLLTATARDDLTESPVECTPENAGPAATAWQLESPTWHAETHDLLVDYNLTVGQPAFLFGPGGLAASKDSVLGLAVEWVDADASQRGTIPLGELAAEDRRRPWQITNKIELPRGTLRGTLKLFLILYLKTAGAPVPRERHLASTPGTVLGVLHEDRLIIEGNGAIFPVRQTVEEGGPLWRLSCNWDDLNDPVSEETVCLELNQKHPDYPALYAEGDRAMSPMLREVLAGALQVLLTKTMSLSEDSDPGGEPGSIGQLVAYVKDVFDLDIDKGSVSVDPEALAADLRIALRRETHA